MELRTAADDDIGYVESLLRRNDLPHEDVATKPECFVVGYADGEPVGIGGVETFDSVGLLRSIVVEEERRGEGYGSAICEELETEAAANEIDELYLLTTTAADFFEDRGYEVIDRGAAPTSIQKTSEFADLCPDSATCMAKSL